METPSCHSLVSAFSLEGMTCLSIPMTLMLSISSLISPMACIAVPSAVMLSLKLIKEAVMR